LRLVLIECRDLALNLFEPVLSYQSPIISVHSGSLYGAGACP